MEERIITLETARLAKGKGFNWPTDARYFYDEAEQRKWIFSKKGISPCVNSNEDSICAPTQSLLQKWFRDNFNIILDIVPYYDESDLPLSPERIGKPLNYFVWGTYDEDFSPEEAPKFPTYEDALEHALQTAFNLI